MKPEQQTSAEQTNEALSYTKQLESELSKAKTPIEEAGAVNIVLGQMMTDAEAGAVRKVTKNAEGQETVTIYGRDQMMKNLAELYHMIDPSDDGMKMSLAAAEVLVPRAGGLRNVMNSLLGEHADPIRKEATMYWLKRNYEEAKKRFPSEDIIDEADIETRPRQEVMDMIAEAQQPSEIETPIEAAVEHAMSPEALLGVKEEMGETAVEQVVPEPETAPVEQLFDEEPAIEQPESTEEEPTGEDEDGERLARQRLHSDAESLARSEHVVADRINNFATDTKRLMARIESDNYPAGAVGRLIQSHSEALPSMMAMLGRLKDDGEDFKQSALGESSILTEDVRQLLTQRIDSQREQISLQMNALQDLFRSYESVMNKAFQGVNVTDDLYRLNESVTRIDAAVTDFSLRRSLQSAIS